MSEFSDRYRRAAARFIEMAHQTDDPERKARLIALAQLVRGRAERSASRQQQQQPQPDMDE